MTCRIKHTKFQPSDDEFKCPECGAKIGDFCIDEPVGDEECELLHQDDDLFCYKCKYRTSGRHFTNRVKKKLDMVPCSHCKGRGFVKKKTS